MVSLHRTEMFQLIGTAISGLLLSSSASVERPAAPSRARGGVTMMPSSTPRVPFKYPGMESPQWIDIYNRMYRERIMFLNQPITDNLANNIIAVLLYLESEDASSPVSMYCNVGGGVMKSGLALYDTMRIMPYEIQTVNMGMCAQVAAFIVAGGTPGKRFALPNSRFAMQNPGMYAPLDEEGRPVYRRMQATEMQLEVEEVLRDKKRLLQGFSGFTGRSVERLEADFGRNFYLDANEAKDYGLVDQILMPKSSNIALGTFSSSETAGSKTEAAA